MHVLQARLLLLVARAARPGAILDGRAEGRQRALRRTRSNVHPIDGRVPTRAA